MTNKTTLFRIFIKERYSKLNDDQYNLQSTDIQSQNHEIRLSSDSRINHERICICSLSLAPKRSCRCFQITILFFNKLEIKNLQNNINLKVLFNNLLLIFLSWRRSFQVTRAWKGRIVAKGWELCPSCEVTAAVLFYFLLLWLFRAGFRIAVW